jgi:hypothetical protein
VGDEREVHQQSIVRPGGRQIPFLTDYTDTTGAGTDSATVYDIKYTLTSKNKNGYEQGGTNSTSFETT